MHIRANFDFICYLILLLYALSSMFVVSHFVICLVVRTAEVTMAKNSSGLVENAEVQNERSKSLSIFGVLISPKLRASQLSFEKVIFYILYLTSKIYHILSIEIVCSTRDTHRNSQYAIVIVIFFSPTSKGGRYQRIKKYQLFQAAGNPSHVDNLIAVLRIQYSMILVFYLLMHQQTVNIFLIMLISFYIGYKYMNIDYSKGEGFYPTRANRFAHAEGA
ncbi:hypothetical protein GmHk_19G055515 [Glycine max]|nr:hypothetical protein GmHk_19G055515 [Glycine max]